MSRRRPGARPFLISTVVHVALLVPLVVLARPPEPMEFETVKVTLVSPPPAEVVAAEPEPTPTQPQPEPEPEPVRETPEPEVTTREEPPPEPRREDIERPDTEKPPETPPAQPTQPRETESAPEAATGGDDLNIAMEGREFPFPEYLGNVIVQVKRYFRWNDESNPKGVVYFEITTDGSARNIRMVRPSGNIRFDFAVQGAVETAGSQGAFGPLPDGYAGSFLPVQLEIEPPR